MSSPSSHYTYLFPKHPNVTGNADQAYHCRFEDFFDYLLNAIGAGTITAIWTIAPSSTSLTYIYAPQIHTNLRGRFKGFVGNASNKLGKFSCIPVDSSVSSLFPVIASKLNMDDGIPTQTGIIPLHSSQNGVILSANHVKLRSNCVSEENFTKCSARRSQNCAKLY
jgi:hypothetical protein